MKSLPVDKRGFPIPYTVLVDKNGAHFKINDGNKIGYCLEKRACHICGGLLTKNDYWFVGGQMSAFHQFGAYIDAAMHKECVVYALQVCPYMAFSQYKATDASLAIMKTENKGQIFYDPTRITDIQFFVLVKTENYDIRNYYLQTLFSC